MGVVAVLVVGQFEPILSVGTWDKGQSDVENMHRRGGLTFVDTVHLECPPAKFSKLVKPYTPLSLLLPVKSYRKLSGSCLEHIYKKRTCPGSRRAPPGFVFEECWVENKCCQVQSEKGKRERS